MAPSKRNGTEICIGFALLEKIPGQSKIPPAAIAQVCGCSHAMAGYFMTKARKIVAAEAAGNSEAGENETNGDSDKTPKATPTKKGRGRPKKKQGMFEDGEDDDEELVTTPTVKRKREASGTPRAKKTAKNDSAVKVEESTEAPEDVVKQEEE